MNISFSAPKNRETILTIGSKEYKLNDLEDNIGIRLISRGISAAHHKEEFELTFENYKNQICSIRSSDNITSITIDGQTDEYKVGKEKFLSVMADDIGKHATEWLMSPNYWWRKQQLSTKEYEEYKSEYEDAGLELRQQCKELKEILENI